MGLIVKLNLTLEILNWAYFYQSILFNYNFFTSLDLFYGFKSFYGGVYLLNFIVPIKIYTDLLKEKSDILAQNKGKAGIYRFINKINGSSYIGSAVDLRIRLKDYFTVSYLRHETLKQSSIIYRSLLKNGYENFSLEILEYCDPNKCIEREDYYFKFLNPDYNICKKAGSSLGRVDYEETKLKKSAKALSRLIPAVPGLQVQVLDLCLRKQTNDYLRFNS